MYYGLRLSQYEKKIIKRDFIYKTLFGKNLNLPKVKNLIIEIRSNNNQLDDLQILNQVNLLESLFGQRPKINCKKKKINIFITNSKEIQVYNNLDILINFVLFKNQKQKFTYGFPSQDSLDVYLNDIYQGNEFLSFVLRFSFNQTVSLNEKEFYLKSLLPIC